MRGRTGRGLTLLVPLALVCASCGDDGGGLGPTEPEEIDPATQVVFEMTDPRIRESSGLAASRKHSAVFWTHNDRGNDPLVFAVSADTGDTVATLHLATRAVDWEDVAVSDSGVWVGDIGGGTGERRAVRVLRFEEPDALEDGSPAFVEYPLTYEDGAHDAEALLVDPRTDQVYVATKDGGGGGLYAAPPRLSRRGQDNVLTRIADAPPNVTGGSWSPTGSGFVLRNYPRAFVYSGLGQGGPTVVDLPTGPPRGESVVLLEDGSMLVGSEGEGSAVVRAGSPTAAGSDEQSE